MKVSVTRLNLYPIKSCGGLSVFSFRIGEEGPEIPLGEAAVFDRGWMFVNPEGDFQTQRALTQMALMQPELENDRFYLKIDGKRFEIPLKLENPARRHVQVWGNKQQAAIVPGDVSKAASDFLKTEVELVHFDAACKREVLVKSKGQGVNTRFTDSQQYLVISEESLKDLNQKLSVPITHARFRANIWIEGAGYPYREDQITKLEHAAGFDFEATKGCARCKIITVNEDKGIVESPEPLKVLAQYRRKETQVYFGQYYLVRASSGILKVGDELQGALAAT